jgi:hypothetical protein
LKKLAEQFDALAETMLAISGTFRSAVGGGEVGSGDGKATKPVRGAKPAAETTEDTVREALKELAASKGKEKMAEALASVGAGRLPDVDASQYDELLSTIKEMMEAEDEPPAKATKGRKPKKAAPDMDTLTEKFKALVASDKATAKQLLKDAGLAKLSDIDADDEEAMTDMLKAIEDALEGGDALV